MKKIKIISISLISLVSFAFINNYSANTISNNLTIIPLKEQQTINMFVSHGHCSTPFAGEVEKLQIFTPKRVNSGNPLEGMNLSFEINPNTFQACRGKEFTKNVKTPGVFIGNNNENIKFRSTDVYTMGVDWYQVNGKLSIKGVERNIKFFASAIKNLNFVNGANELSSLLPTALILEGQMDLTDWEIDYDKLVNGKSNSVPTKYFHLNMKIELD